MSMKKEEEKKIYMYIYIDLLKVNKKDVLVFRICVQSQWEKCKYLFEKKHAHCRVYRSISILEIRFPRVFFLSSYSHFLVVIASYQSRWAIEGLLCVQTKCVGRWETKGGFCFQAVASSLLRQDERVGNTLKAESNILMSLAQDGRKHNQQDRENNNTFWKRSSSIMVARSMNSMRNTRLGSISNRLKWFVDSARQPSVPSLSRQIIFSSQSFFKSPIFLFC